MNLPNEHEIEQALRHPPQPVPPANLKEKLLMNAKSKPRPEIPGASATLPSRESWFRRWWPVLVPAGLSTACLVMLASQQQEIGSLRKEIDKLSATVATEKKTPAIPADNGTRRSQAKSDAEELVGLREKASKLSSEISELEKMRAENNQLKTQLANASAAVLSTEELAGVEAAQEKARMIQCVNNMKQLGLAARIWAADNNDMYPSDFLSMTNEMNTPKILHCPSDTSHEAATSWATFTAANNSYEWFLDPPGSDQGAHASPDPMSDPRDRRISRRQRAEWSRQRTS